MADKETQAQTKIKKSLAFVEEVQADTATGAAKLSSAYSTKLFAILSTMLTVGGLFYQWNLVREHATGIRPSITGLGSFWVGLLATCSMFSMVFGYGVMLFQKTLVHHKDIREYPPYFSYKSKFVERTAHVNGSL